MTALSQQRCFNHAFREAVACCPDCKRYYCRECITEHDDKVLCASCLAEKIEKEPAAKRAFGGLRHLFPFALGLLMTWVVFYYLGRFLVALPTAFHDGTLWKDLW
jgi:hypothetical protein